MRKLIASLVIGLGLVMTLMVLVTPSVGQQPDPLLNRARQVSLQGTIADLPTGTVTSTWMITDRIGNPWALTVTEDTKLLPPGVTPEVEDSVHVLGSQGPDGEPTLLAKHVVIEKRSQRGTRPSEFHGAIEKLPESTVYSGTWVVAGITFTVDAKTMIHPPMRTPTEGMQANVIAFEQLEGTLWAKNIVLQEPDNVQDEVKIAGMIKELPNSTDFVGLWIVDGFTVTVTDTTEIEGSPAVSLTAKVEGIPQGPSSLLATKIEIKGPGQEKVEFEGTIKSLTDTRPSQWAIYTEDLSPTGVISVWVYSTTHIIDKKAPLGVGSKVEVKAVRQEDGSLAALRIKVEDGDFGGSKWVEYEGTVLSADIEAGKLIITDSEPITFQLYSETKIVPPWADLAAGTEVKVKALERSDGSLLAFLIKVERQEPVFVEFQGAVVMTDSIPGEWVIETVSPTDRVTIEIVTRTMVLPPRATLALSSSVKVRALEKENGYEAVWIKIEMPDHEELEFEGTVVTNGGKPGDWVIEAFSPTREITVAVAQSTLLIPSATSLTAGSKVEVKAVGLEGGKLRALWIKLEEEHGDDEEERIDAFSIETSVDPTAPLELDSTGDEQPARDADSALLNDVSARATSSWMLRYQGLRLGGPIQ